MAGRNKALTFMNNKGGVGKTTLACNLAYDLAFRQNKQVLVIDLDPQCNATQLLLEEDVWSRILSNNAAHNDRQSILYALSEIRRGDSGVKSDITPVWSKRFGVNVLTGHPALALVEDTLSSSWSDLLAGDLGGARRTNWLTVLLADMNREFDYAIIDVGPSLGALNRSVIIGSDYVLTPTAADLFSLNALENISEWIQHWGLRFQDAMRRVAAGYPDEPSIPTQSADMLNASYIGFTIQQYVTKSSADGKRRGVKSYDYYRNQIPSKAQKLAVALRPTHEGAVNDLGTVPHMFSMVPLAQGRHAPIASLTKEDGLRGAQIGQQANYRKQLEEIGDRLFALLSSVDS
ncbi:ParA family protein [Tomitella gaofuii]|uniref:ParA family protein n=1 Tax=Tomitella gaofuii TaxID=2760083 RepID=UPI0015FE6D86|nr:ParA family protein [Tomitella gaofuii]